MSLTVKTATINKEGVALDLCLSIWQITKKLKGRIDAEDFSKYVSAIFFYRFLSENLTHYLNKEEQENDPEFDFVKLSHLDLVTELRLKEEPKQKKGFFIHPSLLFGNVLEGLKNSPYFIPNKIKIGKYPVTTKAHTYIEIDSKYDILDVSLLIDRIFSIVYCSTIGQWDAEGEEFSRKWYKLFRYVEDEFSLLGDTRSFSKYSKKQVPELINTIKRKNEKLIEIMEVVGRIPLNDLIKETSDYNIKEILEIQEEIDFLLYKTVITEIMRKQNERYEKQKARKKLVNNKRMRT